MEVVEEGFAVPECLAGGEVGGMGGGGGGRGGDDVLLVCLGEGGDGAVGVRVREADAGEEEEDAFCLVWLEGFVDCVGEGVGGVGGLRVGFRGGS